jgi:hypothetical protein
MLTREMKYVNVSDEVMSQILNKGLRVWPEIVSPDGRLFDVGDKVRFEEFIGTDPSGRLFYGKVKHVAPGFFQFELYSYMDAEDGERFTISGDYPSESHKFPEDFITRTERLMLPCDGSVPVWLFEGIRWFAELGVTGVEYSPGVMDFPSSLVLRVQKRKGGEEFYRYGYLGQEKHPIGKGYPNATAKPA